MIRHTLISRFQFFRYFLLTRPCIPGTAMAEYESTSISTAPMSFRGKSRVPHLLGSHADESSEGWRERRLNSGLRLTDVCKHMSRQSECEPLECRFCGHA